MPYESTITFTLDTICPWTYLALLRLEKALSAYRASHPPSSNPKVTFTLTLAPYQLYPDFSPAGEDKHEWYKRKRYDGDEERVQKYERYMTALGRAEGVEFDFSTRESAGGEEDGKYSANDNNNNKGMIANTLPAHRILHHIQTHHGAAPALLALHSLYHQYFCERAHPSSLPTLTTACRAAKLTEEETQRLLIGEPELGLEAVRQRIARQTGDGVDSVPYVVFEGRRRDFTVVGAKEIEGYAKVLGQVEKEV